MSHSARVLVAGEARGPLLRLSEPLSFWGGVDPHSGTITQPRHPQHLQQIGGHVLAMPTAIGSSSSSAILLELLYSAQAPVALIMARADAILALGVVVAREMGMPTIPVLEWDASHLDTGTFIRIDSSGELHVTPAATR